MPSGALKTLREQVARDLSAIEVTSAAWVPPRTGPDGEPVHDVVIVGAGLSGLAIGFGLLRNGIANFRIIDQAPRGREGPWLTCARMATLRSPKEATGPDLGVPSLTFRSWFEATYSEDAWAGLGKIAPEDWMAYLEWYRETLRLPVENEVRLDAIAGSGDGLALSLDGAGGPHTIHARRVVLATGVDGSGKPRIPGIVEQSLPRDRYTHSAEQIAPGALTGKDVAVLGSAASAFDWANAALVDGARSVSLFARRSEIPYTEYFAWANSPGFLGSFSDLDDLHRWRFIRRIFELQPPPTQEMFDRVDGHPRFTRLMGKPWTEVGIEDGRIRVTAGESWRFDHLLLGTGYELDLTGRPELGGLAGKIALWRDRFTPPEGEEHAEIAGYPYLGPAFEFTEREAGSAPYLSRIHVFNTGAVPSLGPICNGITGLKYGAPKIVAGIARSLFLEDADRHLDALMSYNDVHFRADTHAVAR